MAEQTSSQTWVDRYVREELTVDEVAEFEVALMDSPAMQLELETTLGLRQALMAKAAQDQPVEGPEPGPMSGGGGWRLIALVATVVLALFSTVMFWKVSNESAALRQQLHALGQPRTDILRVPVNIMRSVGNQKPDVTVQKPPGQSAILLDIELGPRSREHETLVFALNDEAGIPIISWTASPSSDGHSSVLLNSEQVPVSRLWLEISSGEGQPLERRLLEFQ